MAFYLVTHFYNFYNLKLINFNTYKMVLSMVISLIDKFLWSLRHI